MTDSDMAAKYEAANKAIEDAAGKLGEWRRQVELQPDFNAYTPTGKFVAAVQNYTTAVNECFKLAAGQVSRLQAELQRRMDNESKQPSDN